MTKLEELKAVENAQKKTNGADMPVYIAKLNIMLEVTANTSLEADNMFEAIYDDCVVALGDAYGMVTLSSAVTEGQKETPEFKKMIADFDAKCAASGHGWSVSPLGGEYCKACGATRNAQPK